jgi:hypothetical protein
MFEMVQFLHKKKVHKSVRRPKVGIGIGNSADITKRLTAGQHEFLYRRDRHRVDHARAVLSFHEAPRHLRMKAILAAIAIDSAE